MHALLLVALILVFHLLTFREGHQWGGDFAMYIHHAQNLAEGVGYSDTGYLYNVAAPEIGPRHYPPIFPLVLAPVVLVFGLNLTAMKALVALLFSGLLLVIDWAFRDELARGWRLLLVGILGFSPFLWDFTDYVASDVLFSLLLYACLGRVRDSQRAGGDLQGWRAPALGLGLYLLMGTRTLGVVAIPAILLAELWHRRRVRAPLVVALGLALALTLVQSLLIGSDASYIDQIRVTPASIVANLKGYAVALHSFWDAGAFVPWTAAATAIFSGFALLGIGRRVRKGLDVFDFLICAYVAAIVLWPDNQGPRFLVPIVPIYLLYSFQGIAEIPSLSGPTRQGMAIAVLALLAAFTFALGYAARDWSRIPKSAFSPGALELFEWVDAETPPDSAFLFAKPRVLSLLTGRPAGVLQEGSMDSRWEFIDLVAARYLILNAAGSKSTFRFAALNAGHFEEVWRNEEFIVLRIDSPR